MQGTYERPHSMTNTFLVFPQFAMVLITLVVLFLMFRTRVAAVRDGRLSVAYFKTYNSVTPPDDVVQSQRHFTNLFELPVLFYAGCLVAMNVPIYGFWILVWPWIFVAARVAHAVIHLGANKVYPRMIAYGIQCLAIAALWLHIMLAVTLGMLA